MANGNGNSLTPKLFIGLFVTIIIAVMSFGGTVIRDNRELIAKSNAKSTDRDELIIEKLHSINTRVTAIEANRFTSRDGLTLLQSLEKKLENYPPRYLIEKVNENGRKIDSLIVSQAQLEVAINNKR